MATWDGTKTNNRIFRVFFGGIILLLSFLGIEKTVSIAFTQKEIIYIDSFDLGNLNQQWQLGKSKHTRIICDPKHAHSGTCSLEIVVPPGKGIGEGARIWFMPGYDKVHVRWYVKFDDNFDQGNLMHLNRLSAGKGKWGADGTAGKRPNGFDFFRTNLDIWRNWGRNPPPGEPILYSYFPFMKKDRKTGKYYGNMFKGNKKILIKRGRWYCMEMMLKANDAEKNNGEQAFWINGKLIAHYKNIVWRLDNSLKINSFSLGLYIHDNKKFNRIWYDDVVVSNSFIGL